MPPSTDSSANASPDALAASSENKGLDISQDLAHQEKEWKLERVGWVLIATLMLANLLGLFGRGPLAERTIGAEDAALQVHYQQWERYKAATFLRARVSATAGDTLTRLTVGNEFIGKVRITEVVPEPERVEAGAREQIYEFNLSHEEGPVDISIFYEPFSSGSVNTRIGLEGSLSYEFHQFFFP